MNVRHAYDGLWRKRLDALDKVWPQFVAGDTEALHKVRVASRRIRELHKTVPPTWAILPA